MEVKICTTYGWTCPRCDRKSPKAFTLKGIRTHIRHHQVFVHSSYDYNDSDYHVSGMDQDVTIIKLYSHI